MATKNPKSTRDYENLADHIELGAITAHIINTYENANPSKLSHKALATWFLAAVHSLNENPLERQVLCSYAEHDGQILRELEQANLIALVDFVHPVTGQITGETGYWVDNGQTTEDDIEKES